MSGRIQIRARARSDLLEIAAWLDEESQSDVGSRFIEAAFDAFDFLAESPHAGRREPSRFKSLRGLRGWCIRRFRNYRVYYRPRRGGVEIVRILHVARDAARREL